MCKRTASLFLTSIILLSFLSIATAQEPVPIEPPPSPPPIIAPPTEPADPEVIMAAVQNLHDAFNAHDMELWKTYVTDDIVLDAVPSPPPASGKEEAAAFFGAFIQGFPDLYGNLDRVLISGNIAVAQTTMTGTHLGEWAGIAPTGSRIQVMVLEVMEFEGDKEKRATFYWDALSMMVQLGLMPASELDPALLVPSFTLPDPEPTGLAAVEAVVEAQTRWNARDLVGLAKMMRLDDEVMIAALGATIDRDAFIAVNELIYFTAFPDIQVEIVRSIDMGDGWVLTEVMYGGTQDGPYLVVPATGRPIEVRAALLYHFDEDDLETNLNGYFDNLTILTQLGVFPPPTEPPIVEEGPLAGIHTSIASGIVTESGETEQVMKDGVMHIITDGFEYEMQVESTWDNGETTTCDLKVRGYMDLIPISETEAVGKGYSTTEQYSPDGELVFVGSAESDVTASLVTGGSSSTFYIYASGLGEYAGYSHISIGETRIWIDEDGTRRVEATGECIVSKMEHDFTIASASLAATEAEAPLTGLHTSELSGLITNPGEVTQETIDGVLHIITRRIEYDQQVDTVWDTGETDVVSMRSYANMDLVPISEAEAVGKSSFTSIAYSENDEPIWFISGESDETADLTTGESWSKIFAVGSGYGRYAGYTHISVVDFHAWVNEDGIPQVEGTSRCLVMKVTQDMSKAYFVEVQPGLNMISMPLNSMVPYTARSLAEKLSATVVIEYNEAEGRFVGFTLDAPDSGFDILGGKGYIVNVAEGGVIGFTGTGWSNQPPVMAAPPVSSGAWAFVVSGSVLDGDMMSASDGDYTVTVKNLRTGAVAAETVGESGYFAAAYADLSRKAVVEAGDKVEVAVIDSSGKVVSGPFVHDVTLDSIRDAVVKVQLRLGDIIPEKSALLQNYPNPFNPETWIPFHLKGEGSVSIRIFNLSGQLIKTLDLGHRDAGVYVSRTKAAYWDGKNEAGEEVSSGIYFYSIAAGDFSATKKMIIRK